MHMSIKPKTQMGDIWHNGFLSYREAWQFWKYKIKSIHLHPLTQDFTEITPSTCIVWKGQSNINMFLQIVTKDIHVTQANHKKEKNEIKIIPV